MTQHDEKGTGKHPHKSTEEPYPHHEASSHSKNEGGQSSHAAAGSGSESGQGGQSESSDLNEREYRDAQGNIHHHTHTSEEQRGKEN